MIALLSLNSLSAKGRIWAHKIRLWRWPLRSSEDSFKKCFLSQIPVTMHRWLSLIMHSARNCCCSDNGWIVPVSLSVYISISSSRSVEGGILGLRPLAIFTNKRISISLIYMYFKEGVGNEMPYLASESYQTKSLAGYVDFPA